MWELRKGDILLGTLTLTEQDMFWLFCDFVTTAAFEEYRALFAEEYRLLDTEGIQEAWEAIASQITALKLSLHDAGTFDDTNYIMLHIVDDEAWFRSLNGARSGWISS